MGRADPRRLPARPHRAGGEVRRRRRLIIETDGPKARYWAFQLCGLWFEGRDYGNRHTSINHHQARIDADGRFRCVLAHEDPGVANWLDAAGHTEGLLQYRWVWTEDSPEPTCRADASPSHRKARAVSELTPLPAGVRALNTIGRGIRALGVPLGRLDTDALIAAACKRSGLSDFGGETFREGLTKLVDSLERDASLSTLGRVIARTEILLLLENRLQLQEWRRRHPEIASVKVARPIFIIGMPRTGTTILHEVIAQECAYR
jgi:hypothetical protein